MSIESRRMLESFLFIIEIVRVISIRPGIVWLLFVVAPGQQRVFATRLGDKLRFLIRFVPALRSRMNQSKQVIAPLPAAVVELNVAEICMLILSLNLIFIFTLTQIIEIAWVNSSKSKRTVLCEIFLLFAPPLGLLFRKIWVVCHREAYLRVRICHRSVARHQGCTCCSCLCTWLAGSLRLSLAVVVWPGNLTWLLRRVIRGNRLEYWPSIDIVARNLARVRRGESSSWHMSIGTHGAWEEATVLSTVGWA